MKLTKMHGLGNDFILFSDSQGANKDYTDLAIRLCDRRTGIGADGLVIVVPSNYKRYFHHRNISRRYETNVNH